ncbi:MAG: three-Cys-motif partner protein TcmP [Paludibacteraceae bacterium]|nr:three-Cys-motif partner protein TcmP [Paludibacteraceae bacterium]
MSKKNDDFFKEKKPWSEVKDQLLGCYFKPYVQKILYTRKPLEYIDCFAGKGKFDDGKPGSPLIALDLIEECLTTTKMASPQIRTTFIDLNYADDLRNNLQGYQDVNIVSGKYEDHILRLLRGSRNRNVFLYIDPYGIKALRCSLFDSFAIAPFNSIELLINLNSFGFIREACNALGIQLQLDDPTLFDDLVEYDPTKLTATDKSVQDLNEIAGGNYWQAIIKDYKAGRINGYEAEERFAEQYCRRLSQSYAYVLNMPLRIKPGQRPKYRMIHLTNHPDGCLLMVDNICSRWEAWQDVQNGGQFTLFQEDVNNQSVDEDEIRRKVEDHYSQFSEYTSLNESMAQFFMKYGPICKTKDIRDALKDLEGYGNLQVLRDPAVTGTGRPSKFMEEKTNKQKVSLRWAR